jgi:hypothetical protein
MPSEGSLYFSIAERARRIAELSGAVAGRHRQQPDRVHLLTELRKELFNLQGIISQAQNVSVRMQQIAQRIQQQMVSMDQELGVQVRVVTSEAAAMIRELEQALTLEMRSIEP